MPKLSRRTALYAAAALPAALTPAAPPAAAQPAAPAIIPPPPSAAANDRPLFGASVWQEANGLTVVLAESHRAPVVGHYLFYGAGGAEDPAGKSGLAHFMEHMMFKGSAHVAPGALSRIVAREGGQDNAFTSRDVTAYYQHVEASRLELVVRLESDRFTAPLFPADQLEPEREVVLEERRMRTESNPRGRFSEAFNAAMWGRQHWLGRPIIGWPEEIRALSRADMQDFYDHRYAPGNAVLAVAGAVKEADLRRLVSEYYAPVTARTVNRRDRAAPPAQPLEARFALEDPTLRDAGFVRSHIAPSLGWGETGFAQPLEVLAHLLGGGIGSRLHRALVQGGLANAVSCSYDGDTPSVSSFEIGATLRPGVTPAALEAAIDRVVAELLDSPPGEAEVQRAIRQQTAGVLLSLDGVGVAARLLGNQLANGLALETMEYWPRRLHAVTPPQVAAAARAVLGRPGITGWQLPAGTAAPGAQTPGAQTPGAQTPGARAPGSPT